MYGVTDQEQSRSQISEIWWEGRRFTRSSPPATWSNLFWHLSPFLSPGLFTHKKLQRIRRLLL